MDRYRYPDEARAALEGLQQPLAVYQLLEGSVTTLLVSDGFCRLFGYRDRDQAVYDMDHDMYRDVHPDDRERIISAALRFSRDGGEYDAIYRTRAGVSADYQVIHAHGRHVLTETGVRLTHVWYMDEGHYVEGSESAAAGMNRELNSALHEESILKAVHYDALTGLPNLYHFFKLCETLRMNLLSQGRHACLIYIDLNGMKYFNHRNGFAEGDRLLRAFADLMVRFFGLDNCCHVSSDRFAASMEESEMEDTLKAFIREIPSVNGGNSLPARIGVYSTHIEDVPPSSAYDRAKIACDTLPKSEVSDYRLYNTELRDIIARRRYIQSSLDRAISEKWIQVYYQPIVRAVNEKVCDVECLARWIDPVEGFMSPGDFIPWLEESGQIYRLDLYVLEEALEKIRTCTLQGKRVVPHSINLSRSDFDACDIVEEIRRRVDDAGVDRKMITIEITESVIGSDFDFMKRQVERFRELGFPVWMDDFGSGYSSLDVLQGIQFDLIKFDMSFMRRLNETENARIILTELMKMTTALGLDTVCEGVETEEQVRFLQEIGCSKLQGFYFSRPVPAAELESGLEKGLIVGFEDTDSSEYYETIGRINLYDMNVITRRDTDALHNLFNATPLGIVEVRGNTTRFVRSNPSYREFIRRYFGMEMADMTQNFVAFTAPFMHSMVKKLTAPGSRTFYDEKMPDGSVVHSFARRIGQNPVTGEIAIAIAVLSISDPDEGESYADIARALAADYYNIYVVDLDTDRFIEYTSPVGEAEIAVERHGTNFFAASIQAAQTRIYAEDRELFLTWFTRENILRELDTQGVFTATYRLVDTGTPMYVNMKITRMPDTNRIILGVSIIDAQMRQLEQLEGMEREREALARVMTITEDYFSLYSVNLKDDHYLEYTASSEYESLGFAKEGTDFFLQGRIDGMRTVCPEDLPLYLREFTKENILKRIHAEGKFNLIYRLIIQGEPVRVCLIIAPYQGAKDSRLLAGVRRWRERDG